MGKLNIGRAVGHSAAVKFSQASVQGQGSRPATHPSQQPVTTRFAYKIDRAVGQSVDIARHPTTIIGAGTRVNPAIRASSLKTGFEAHIDRAVGASAEITRASQGIPGGTFRVSPTERLTPNELSAAISPHVRRIEAIKGQREASAARTAEVKRELDRAKGGGGGFNEDQPRDEQGRWV